MGGEISSLTINFGSSEALARAFENEALSGADAFTNLSLLEALVGSADTGEETLPLLLDAYKKALAFGNTNLARELGPKVAHLIREQADSLNRVLAQFKFKMQGHINPFGDGAATMAHVREMLDHKAAGQQAYVGSSDSIPSGPRPKKVFKQRTAGDSRVAAFATGMRMGQELRQTLELSQSLELRQTLQLGMRFSSGDFYQNIFASAKKLHVKIPELELDFEVAVISRFDLPEVISLGTAGLTANGYPFVVEDFFADLPDTERDLFIKLIAVHEYGEAIFGDHHLASLLELAVARYWNVLESYLEFTEKRYAAKFRDVALHRLKGPLVQGLRKAGFKIPKEGEVEEEWHPPAKEDPEVRRAMAVIQRYPVPDAVRGHFEKAIRDDMKISEKELEAWVSYVTVLEQTRAFHERALQDVAEALSGPSENYPLALRLALFRPLGVLQHEIGEGTLDGKKLDEELKDHLAAQLMERVLEFVVGGRPQLLDDPILKADRKTLEKLTGLDAKLWNSLGLKLLLVSSEKNRKEQEKIEGLRRAAWQYALSAGPALEEQAKALQKYQKGVERFNNSVRYPVEGLIRTHREKPVSRYIAKGKPVGYFDHGEYLADHAAWLWEDAHEIIHDFVGEFPFMADLVNAEVRGAFPALASFDIAKTPVRYQGKIDLPIDTLARLEYLINIYSTAETGVQRKIRQQMAKVIHGMPEKTFREIGEAYQAGLFSQELAIEIAGEILEKEAGFYAAVFMPVVEKLPYQLAREKGDLEKVIVVYREIFHEEVMRRAGAMPAILLQALKNNPVFWKVFQKEFIDRITPVFELARSYPDVLPLLSQTLSKLSPEILWRRLDLVSALTLEPKEVREKEGFYTRSLPDHGLGKSFKKYLAPYSLPPKFDETTEVERLDDTKGWEKVQAWGRLNVLKFVQSMSEAEHFQLELDLYTAWTRRGLIEHFAKRLGVPREEIEKRLPYFKVSPSELGAADNHKAIVSFLITLLDYFLNPSEQEALWLLTHMAEDLPKARLVPYPEVRQAVAMLQAFAPALYEKKGYDRFGTLGTKQKELLKQKGGLGSLAKLNKHFETILGHYAGLESLTGEETGEEMVQMADEITQIEWEDVEEGDLFMPTVQLYALRALQKGAKFARASDIYEYLKSSPIGALLIDRVSISGTKNEQGRKCFEALLLLKWSPYLALADKITERLALNALEEEDYDKLGELTQQERKKLTQRILDRANVRVRQEDYELLADHWSLVIDKLVTCPNTEGAKRELLKVFRDISNLDRDLASHKRGRSYAIDNAIWLARHASVLLSIRAGEVFKNTEDIFKRIPREMIEGLSLQGFRAGLIRRPWSAYPRRREFARRILAHLAAQR